MSAETAAILAEMIICFYKKNFSFLYRWVVDLN